MHVFREIRDYLSHVDGFSQPFPRVNAGGYALDLVGVIRERPPENVLQALGFDYDLVGVSYGQRRAQIWRDRDVIWVVIQVPQRRQVRHQYGLVVGKLCQDEKRDGVHVGDYHLRSRFRREKTKSKRHDDGPGEIPVVGQEPRRVFHVDRTVQRLEKSQMVFLFRFVFNEKMQLTWTSSKQFALSNDDVIIVTLWPYCVRALAKSVR